MDKAALRAELRQQHSELRDKLEKGREAALHEPAKLQEALLEISNLLRWHHLREEEMLIDVFPTLDDWGMIRAAANVEEHAEEHKEIYETLILLSTTHDPKAASTAAVELFDRILAHMAEETLFLGSP